jgi:hypothetical protein
MNFSSFLRCVSGLVVLFATAGCGGVAESPGAAEGAASQAEGGLYRYHREYVFVSSRGESPLVVPLAFRATDRGTELERGARGWLARGGTWDRFLDETDTTGRAGGVWRVVPQGDLRITAGGPAELETIRFQRGERRLRVEFENPITAWNQGGDTRFRLLTGRLSIGAETHSGPMLEILRVERTLEDGWPAGQDFDAMFLTSGDSLQIVLAERLGGSAGEAGYAWTRSGSAEREWERAEIRWLEMRPYQEARRDIPRRWSFRIPSADLEGEVEAAGFDALLGPERAGRRAVEVRFTVQGWVEIQGERRGVAGMVRHTQQ